MAIIIPTRSIPDGSVPLIDISTLANVTLVHTPAEILVQYLVSAESMNLPSDSSDWPIYTHRMPDSSDVANNTIAVFNTGGVLDGKDMSGAMDQHRGLQVRVRATSERLGYVQLQGMVEFLIAIHFVLVTMAVDGEIYRINSISQTSDVVPISEDDKRRTHLTVNLLMSERRIS